MSKVFVKKNREYVQNSVIDKLNSVVLTNKNVSPRTVGDAVQGYLEDNFVDCLPKDVVKEFSASFARRAMADFAFTDIDGKYYVVDCKTHNLATAFNMPNLTSVERLARFYEDFNNYFVVLILTYKFEGTTLLWTDCKFIPIELLDWSCLTIGALGWGQIQIANSNKITVNENNTRKKWMLELCNALEHFYPNEIEKITKRIEHFKKIKEFWQKQAD